MKDRKIGKIFIFTDKNSNKHKLITEQIYKGHSCTGCYFYENNINCPDFRHVIGHCHGLLRQDCKTIIFKEVKE